ncbi:MAG TPA: hypothetical protein VFQ38_03925 [Longimicrobiales bacterium]|nr:hypothetical protein [Longimicrobiales bacterium]
MTTSNAAAPVSPTPTAWATRAFVTGMSALGLGMAFALLGVNIPAFFLPGIVLIDLALTLLAVSGILRVLPT